MTARLAAAERSAAFNLLEAGSRGWREPVASWLALTAPGLLLARSVVTLTLIALPWLTTQVCVAPALRMTAAVVLVAHVLSTVWMVHGSARWPLACLFLAGLALDALLAGILLGTDLRPLGLGWPLLALVLAMSFAAGGWQVASCSALAAAIAAAVTVQSSLAAPLIFSSAFAFSPILSVEAVYGGVLLSGITRPFPTALSVETFFAGTPMLSSQSVGASTLLSLESSFGGLAAASGAPALFLPALALVLVALCAGLAVSLLRGAQAKAAVTAAILKAGRLVL